MGFDVKLDEKGGEDPPPPETEEKLEPLVQEKK